MYNDGHEEVESTKRRRCSVFYEKIKILFCSYLLLSYSPKNGRRILHVRASELAIHRVPGRLSRSCIRSYTVMMITAAAAVRILCQ